MAGDASFSPGSTSVSPSKIEIRHQQVRRRTDVHRKRIERPQVVDRHTQNAAVAGTAERTTVVATAGSGFGRFVHRVSRAGLAGTSAAGNEQRSERGQAESSSMSHDLTIGAHASIWSNF